MAFKYFLLVAACILSHHQISCEDDAAAAVQPEYRLGTEILVTAKISLLDFQWKSQSAVLTSTLKKSGERNADAKACTTQLEQQQKPQLEAIQKKVEDAKNALKVAAKPDGSSSPACATNLCTLDEIKAKLDYMKAQTKALIPVLKTIGEKFSEAAKTISSDFKPLMNAAKECRNAKGAAGTGTAADFPETQ